MTIQVNIGEAKTRLSELVAATLRGETVVLAKAGQPVVRLVPEPAAAEESRAAAIARRQAAFDRRRAAFGHLRIDVPDSTSEAELEERWRRKFGPAG